MKNFQDLPNPREKWSTLDLIIRDESSSVINIFGNCFLYVLYRVFECFAVYKNH